MVDDQTLEKRGTARTVEYTVEFPSGTIVGPYKAHTATHAVEQALVDEDVPHSPGWTGDVQVRESATRATVDVM